MSAWDHQLLSRVIRTGDLEGIIEWGITVQDFATAETKAIFQQLIGYHSTPETAGSVWGPQSLQAILPNYVLTDDQGMTIDALCIEVRKNRLKGDSREIIRQFEEQVEIDPTKAVSFLQQRATDLQNDCATNKVDFADAMSRVLYQYERVESGEQVCVVPWPWAPIQEKTLGIRSTDYIVIYGRPKSGKSWVLCFLIAWFFECGARLLIYTKEMDADEIFERVGCCLAGIDYERFVQGNLVPEERIALYHITEMLNVIREQQVVVCLSGKDATEKDTVAWLGAKIEKYQPHAVLVDGMYLMSDAHKARKLNERVRNISNAMRQLGLNKHIPIFATIQANRDAAKNEEANLDEVAFSDSVGQDATMLMRCIMEKNEGTIALIMGGATRRFKLDGFRIYCQPAYNFGYYGELTQKEAEGVIRKDETKPAAGRKTKAKAAGPPPVQSTVPQELVPGNSSYFPGKKPEQ